MKTITTTIKREFLAAIVAKTKTTEFRERKPYWTKRLTLVGPAPFKLRLINGMSKTAPEVTVVIDRVAQIPTEYLLHISKVINVKNWNRKMGRPA